MHKATDRTMDDDVKSHRGKAGDGDMKKEIANLIKKNMNDNAVLRSLFEKYKGDRELVHGVFEAYKHRLDHIQKKAKKFKDLMIHHYSGRITNAADLIKKAKKFQAKLGINDTEFNMFINLVLSEKSLEDEMYKLPATKMAKTLGYSQFLLAGDALSVAVDEESVVQDILRMYGETKSLHAQVVMQSLLYEDCGKEARNGKFCETKHNFFSFVHPVVVALFLPKFKLLDDHMLISNLGYIVEAKRNNRPIMTQPDVEVYYDLIRDPNEHVCDSDSAIKDIKNRYFLQTKLWDSVLNLRQGKYYQDNMMDFLTAIDQCRSNIYDAPDLTYVKDEGAILRRLLAAFSIRPTLVATTRLWGTLGGIAPYGVMQSQVASLGISRLTTVPMVTLRLPMGIENTPMDLKAALSQPQWFVENKMIIPKKQEVVHSTELLIFYVGRRFKSINITRLNAPCNFDTLPMTVAGWERSNPNPVNFETEWTLSGVNTGPEAFVLRSVVTIESKTPASIPGGELVTGCSTYVRCYGDALKSLPTGKAPDMDTIKRLTANASVYQYDPQQAGLNKIKGDADTDPIKLVAYTDDVLKAWRTKGTIFIYQKVSCMPVTCL